MGPRGAIKKEKKIKEMEYQKKIKVFKVYYRVGTLLKTS